MTFQQLTKTSLSLVGMYVVIALWISGASLDHSGGIYAIGFLIFTGGAFPSETAASLVWLGGISIGYVILTSNTSFVGMEAVHGFVCILLAIPFHFLSKRSVARLMRCPHCYWRGPSPRSDSLICPKCGANHLTYSGRSVMTGM